MASSCRSLYHTLPSPWEVAVGHHIGGPVPVVEQGVGGVRALAVLVVLQHAVDGAVHRADHEGIALCLLRSYLDDLQTH